MTWGKIHEPAIASPFLAYVILRNSEVEENE